MAGLAGYGGRYELKGWVAAPPAPAAVEAVSEDLPALRARATLLLRKGGCLRVELRAWSFELNDWVRLEILDAG